MMNIPIQVAVLSAFDGKLQSGPIAVEIDQPRVKLPVLVSSNPYIQWGSTAAISDYTYRDFVFEWFGRRDLEGNRVYELLPEYYRQVIPVQPPPEPEQNLGTYSLQIVKARKPLTRRQRVKAAIKKFLDEALRGDEVGW